ncbi:MAG TPA: two-component regulator propeller domain-containing protein, partial [Chitinophagaceae bacterium]|nr:two-component regulator propeller domain-containing protein [Chitinophagaceae bacterium]
MTAVLLLAAVKLPAQSPAFYHLSTAEGLSDNFVNTVCRDKNGILWIGTSEGLNSFDGNTISTFYKNEYPELPDNNIQQLICDAQNNIWIRTVSNRVTMLDANRRFHSFTIGDTTDKTPAGILFSTKSRGPIVLKGNKHFIRKDLQQNKFELLRWAA